MLRSPGVLKCARSRPIGWICVQASLMPLRPTCATGVIFGVGGSVKEQWKSAKGNLRIEVRLSEIAHLDPPFCSSVRSREKKKF